MRCSSTAGTCRKQAGRDVGTTAAAKAYFEQVLPAAPEPMEADDAPA